MLSVAPRKIHGSNILVYVQVDIDVLKVLLEVVFIERIWLPLHDLRLSPTHVTYLL